MLSLKNAFKDIYKISIDVTNIKKAKGSIDEIAIAIKGLNAEQAVYRMELAGCSKIQMMDALQKNEIAEADIQAALAKQANTTATTANTISNAENATATNADTVSTIANTDATIANTAATVTNNIADEDALLDQWLLIAGEKAEMYAKVESTTATNADTVATIANNAAKKKSFSIINMLKVLWQKLNDVIKANPFTAFLVVVTALGVAMGKIADRVYNAEKYAKKALDKTAEKVKEAKSEIESLNSELQTTQSRIDELNAKENLTLVEQEELERLKETNKELEREIRLKQSILSEEQKEANKDAKKYFTTKKDSLEFESSYEGVEIHEKTDYIGTVEERIEKLQQYADGQIKLSESTIEAYKDYVESAIADFMEEDDYLIEGQDDGLLKRLDALYEKFDIYTNGKAHIIEDRLKDILAKADFQSISKQLEELGKSGELSVATLSSRFPELIEYLEKAGISAQELYQYIMALSNPDALNYPEIERQFRESLGIRDGEINGSSDQKKWDEIKDSFSEDEWQIALEAYLTVKDQYGEHPEGWTVKDWVANIQSELETEIVEIDAQLSISETIDQLNARLKPAFDSLQSAWQDIFTDDGFAISSIDILSTCDSIKSKLDEMSELGLDVDYSAFEDFVKVLRNTESTEEDVRNAFDSLATSITQAGLSGIEDFETLKAALEDLGVVNETIVAFQALAENTDALKESGLDLANATYAQLEAFARERLGAEDAAQGIAILVYQQMLVANNPLDTMASIQALANLGGKAAETAGILAELAQIMAQISNLQSWIANNPGADTSLIEATLAGLERKAERLKSQIYTGVDFENVGGGASKAGSAGSKAGDAYVDAFEKELKQLQTLRDQGKITEKEYLDYLRKLYQKFFKDKKKYAEQYAKYEHEYLQGMKSFYESALSGITSMLDKQISAYGDAKNAAVEALEAERDATIEAKEAEKERLEEKIELIDKEISQKEKEIDGINDEIDAIREANDERQRQLDLQKAQYELERMQNQKTILQYSSDKGMHYVTDTSGVRDAKDAVDDAKTEIEIANKEKEIKLIEKEIDLLEERKDAINEQIDLLDKQIEQINKQYDKLISDTEKYWDDLIKGMEDYKSRWEELAEIEEQAKIIETLRSLGIETGDILNMSEEAFAKFKDEYISILADIYSGNDSMLSALSDTTGQSVEQMGSYLNATQGYIDGLSGISESLNPVAEAIGNVDENMSSLSSTASDANTNISETATNVGNVATNVGAVVDGLNQMPESGKVSGLAGEFETLAKKIEAVAKALGIGEGEAVGTLFQAMSDLNTVTLGGETEGIIGQFTLLKNAIIDVIDTIGSSEEQTVGSLMAAITQLNSIVLDESIIAQFNNLKAAIDSVSSAISGGGESSGNEGQSGNSGSGKGGESGGKSSAGEGGGNSLTGAITEMGETANKIIGEPDAEGDGTVIGEFGSLETAVNDVTAAIGGGDSESGGGQEKGEGDSDNLIGSITSLGETTEEILGEPDGEGVIGRFGEFKDVIAEANEQVTGIADGLAAIDGQTVECTIKINIDSDGFPAYASGTALGAMNLESAEYNAKYEGNAHVSGTANVTGNWGVRKPGKSLVGELGQELWVHSADGTFETVGDNGPEWINTAKGDLIFNHLQTKELLDKGNIVKTGKAYANGTVQYSDGTTILPDGSTLRPLQPGDKMYDMVQKFDAYFKSMDGNLEKLVPNSYYEHQRQMEDMAKQITNISNISNSNKPSVSIGDIHVTCPGVTSQQVAEQLGGVIGKELDKQFNGFSNWTDQMSRRR